MAEECECEALQGSRQWQKIWFAAPPVPVVTWRADRVVLAVGYSGGHLCLFEIDKSVPIHFNQKEKEETAVTFLA